MRPSRASVFGIDVDVVCFDNAVYYVPVYAAQRYVSKQIRAHKYAEIGLHNLVGTVGAAYPGASMVHAGTFFGDMIPSFARKISGRLYAFEPVLENYLLAQSALDVNGLDNVLLFHAGLGSESGVARVQTGKEQQHAGGGSKVRVAAGDVDEGVRSQTISILAIDQFAFDDLAMIQLDVEGFEYHVLEGAVRTIKQHRPVVVLEDAHGECGDLMASLGYTAQAEKVSTNTVYLTPERARHLGYS